MSGIVQSAIMIFGQAVNVVRNVELRSTLTVLRTSYGWFVVIVGDAEGGSEFH